MRHEPRASSLAPDKSLNGYKLPNLPPIPVKVPDIYKPIFFPPILHDLLEKYSSNLPRFDGKNEEITAKKKIQNLEDFLRLSEVE